MSRIITPVNQKRLTNIAVVRLKKGGIRFEIACYPNKVQEWKQNIEKDIDEVLQNQVVFTSVSKGILAKKGDLKRIFGTEDEIEICKQILSQGELQVSEKERKHHQENLLKDIATIITEKCYNTETNKSFTIGVIESALSKIHFSPNPKKTAKQQALAAIKELMASKIIPIGRAPMRLLISVNENENISEIEKLLKKVEDESVDSENKKSIRCLIDPSSFRDINQLVKKAGGTIDILAQNAITENVEK